MEDLEPVWGQIKTQKSNVALDFVNSSSPNNFVMFKEMISWYVMYLVVVYMVCQLLLRRGYFRIGLPN